MANVNHSDLTGANLHESKGVDGAASNTVYVANGSGTGTWKKAEAVSLASTGENKGRPLLADGGGTVGFQTTVWRDLLGNIVVRGAGVNDPTFELITGSTNMWGYSFSAGTLQQFWNTFHVGHDYKPGTKIYMHTHWINAAAVPNTGVVRWGFEYCVAKGHQQEAFPMTATTTVYVNQTCNATRYMHHIAELDVADAIAATSLEPDSLIHVRIFRDAANVADTCTDKVYLLTADCHYEAAYFGTANKAPNFYV
jgi:hypothetical protein